jgi:iron-sulfur cluster repair protein YtfE (RIC family)
MRSPRPETRPLELLEACHAQIRKTCRGLRALAAPENLGDPRIPATAEACARYLRLGLPLHGQDEDLSLAPRLRAQPDVPLAALEALDTMDDEHGAIDEELARLLPGLGALARGEARALRPEALIDLLDRHLALEEARVFPLVPTLPEHDQAAIVREIRLRRAVP